VPVEAVQLDDQGEYVLRLSAAGTPERVGIVSGEVLDAATAGTETDVAVVAGDLQPGDTLVIPAAVPDSGFGGPFGGGRPDVQANP
jgi:hypothetical protein